MPIFPSLYLPTYIFVYISVAERKMEGFIGFRGRQEIFCQPSRGYLNKTMAKHATITQMPQGTSTDQHTHTNACMVKNEERSEQQQQQQTKNE